MIVDPQAKEVRVRAEAWTGNSSDFVTRRDVSQRRLTISVAFFAGAVMFALHSLIWHVVWTISGSPAVYLLPRATDFVAFLLMTAVTYFLTRHSKWALAIAIAVSSVVLSASSLVLYALDLNDPATSGQQRFFVTSASEPEYFSKRSRLQHTLRLDEGRRSNIEASVPATMFREVIGGDSCVDVRWTGGRKYRFFKIVRTLPTGDGNGSWLNAPQDRARCLTARTLTN
jgi:hypothetical protein